MYRALDDAEDITRHRTESFGTLYDGAGATGPLLLRETMNKIIHAERIGWVFDDPTQPLVVCQALPEQKAKFNWTRADIRVTDIARACLPLSAPVGMF
jgi:hypothetical protein